MRPCLYHLRVGLGLLLEHVIAALISLALPTNVSAQLVNDHSLRNVTFPNVVPAGFTVTPRDWGHTIPTTTCFMNTVNVIGELALDDFDGMIPRSRIYRYAEYPELFFGVVGIGGNPIKRSYAILGIYGGLGHMIDHKRFQAVTFDIEWNGYPVAYIYFSYQAPPPSTSIQRSVETGLPDLEIDKPLSPQNSIANDSMPLTSTPMNLGMSTVGPMIPAKTVFLIILGALLTAAERPSKSVINAGLDMRVENVDAHLVFQMPEPHRTRSPYFEYQHVIRTLVALPRFLLKEKKFAETKINIEVGHSLVGVGFLLIKRWDALILLGGGNVSVA